MDTFLQVLFLAVHIPPKTETQGGPTRRIKHKYFILEGGSAHSLKRLTVITEFSLAC